MNLSRHMPNRLPLKHRASGLFVLLSALLAFVSGACREGALLPEKNSAEYRATVAAFYTGLAALQVGDDARAETKLKEATALAEGEPATWANHGLLALRQKDFESASERLEKARSLAPDHAPIYPLLALLESNRGKFAEAVAHLRRAVELNPKDLKSLYSLASEIEREGGADSDAAVARLLEKILETQPDNLAVRLDLARLAAKRGDAGALNNAVAKLSERSSAWPPEVQAQLKALQEAASGGNPRAAAPRVQFLRNVLLRVSDYRQSLAAVKLPPDVVGEPLTRFVKLDSPSPNPAPPDTGLSFVEEQLLDYQNADGSNYWWVGSFQPDGESTPALIAAGDETIQIVGGQQLKFPSLVRDGKTIAPPAHGFAALDFDYDFKNDLALAGEGGFKLYRQEEKNRFADVTARTNLPTSITAAPYAGVWAADIESDGDLDIILGARGDSPRALQNNGDGTFKEARPFAGGGTINSFAWGDVDGDGDPDAALLNEAGQLAFFANERGGQFRRRDLPSNLWNVAALTVADINNDGLLDFVALLPDGSIQRLSDKSEESWEVAEIARLTDMPRGSVGVTPRLFVADFDNNGGLDLLASSNTVGNLWLDDARGKLKLLEGASLPYVTSVADVNADGRLDLLARSTGDVKPEWPLRTVKWINKGTKNYHWQFVRTRAQETTGDQRINSFGVGGEVEIRAGLVVQKQPITSPLVHFGLGEATQTDVARVVWPNGTLQAEFELKADASVAAEQRLKGSCPWVFAYDGKKVSFVTDFIWRSPLGLKINAQDTAGVAMTEEWIKIRGDQLAPRPDGFYDIRITAELWETHFFDHISLMVVDYPRGTEIFVDERFAVPPPKLEVYQTAPLRSVVGAWDDRGSDVSEIVRERDEKYLDTFGRGRYQGVTRDHFVEVEIPESQTGARANQSQSASPLWLVAQGWIHPTDSSINVAISQGGHAPPRGLSLEVADGLGGWKVAEANLGFPAGKSKTVLFDISKVFVEGAPRRLRLRTNLEIYWDAIRWTEALPETDLTTQRVMPDTSVLRYRGYSVVNQADKSSPELPDYERLAGTTARWIDLVGYHTRFGDVRELLRNVDDRYVIMNAGDEMLFRFKAPPPPPDGWVRDFVLVGDGWEKDGDYNTAFSKTVLPLPTHASPDYKTPPTRLEDDPIYRRHTQDWLDYHTRYVTPESFKNALRGGNN